MVYNSTYQSEDMVGIMTDVIGEFGVQTIAFASLIIIAFVFVFMVTKLRGR
jgi:hypothetical protein